MCKTLKSRHDIDDDQELTDMWEQLDNCLRRLGTRNETHWYLRCKGGQQHNTICGFVAEWQANKGRHGSADPDSNHERYLRSSCVSLCTSIVSCLNTINAVCCNALLNCENQYQHTSTPRMDTDCLCMSHGIMTTSTSHKAPGPLLLPDLPHLLYTPPMVLTYSV